MNKYVLTTVSRIALLCCLWAVVTNVSRAVTTSNVVEFSQVVLPNDPQDEVFFGNGLATSGDTAIIGAPGLGTEFFIGLKHGTVYVFGFSGGVWVQQQEFSPTNVWGFGTSTAIDGNLFVVGAPGGITGETFPGRAVVYAKVGGTWFEQQELSPAGIGPFDGFGNSVAISGQTIAVGAPSHTNNGVGAVYVFVQNGTNWVQQAELSSPIGSNFGASVALEGNTLMASSGADVFIYTRSGDTWSLLQMITLPNGSSASRINGIADNTVSFTGNTAVFGAPTTGDGTAYVYTRSGAAWSLAQELVPTIEPSSIQAFGLAVRVAGNNRVFVGAPLSFVLHVFDNIGGTWTDVQRIPDPTFDTNVSAIGFGDPIAVGPHGVLVAAPGANVRIPSKFSNAAGAVYFLTNVQAPEAIKITSASASPSVLWPPNHKLVPVTVSVTTTGSPATCNIVSVTSNQPINGKGDGNTSPDWVITGDLTVLLRAERAGNIKTDRVYTITVECADNFGNTARQNVFVTVPHDNGNK